MERLIVLVAQVAQQVGTDVTVEEAVEDLTGQANYKGGDELLFVRVAIRRRLVNAPARAVERRLEIHDKVEGDIDAGNRHDCCRLGRDLQARCELNIRDVGADELRRDGIAVTKNRCDSGISIGRHVILLAPSLFVSSAFLNE